MTARTDSRTKVLIVDDDDLFRRSIVRILAAAGYECAEAANADEARSSLQETDDVAVLLCDLQMPGESGLGLLKDVAADLPDVAMVMVTGVDDPDTAQVAFDIGAYGYLTKPFDTNELLVAVAGALSRRDLDMSTRRYVHRLEATVDRLRALNGALDGIGTSAGDGETMERLSRAVSLRDEETGGHIERMSRYAAAVVDATGVVDATPDEVRLAVALHDVGKIGVPDTILLKPGPLTAPERVAMQRHAQIGFQLLAAASSDLVRSAADVANAHHEWWDGGGYPSGLRGEEIPPMARLAAVTDVFDALTSDRVYRPRLAVEEAVSIMEGLRGRQFEPRVLDAFLGVIDDVLSIRDEYPDLPDVDRIRVLLVDDHELFVESLVRLLSGEREIRVVGRSSTVAEAVREAAAYEPDVVLMDFELPDGTGPEATRRIKALVPRTKVVMLTGRTDESALAQAIDAGCAGFVTKVEASESLIAVIRLAHDGDSATPLAELVPMLRRLRPTRRGLGSALGRREVEVLGLLAAGLANKEIARRLSLSVNTVRNHVQSILYKLNAHSKLEAVATGVREGIVDYGHAPAS